MDHKDHKMDKQMDKDHKGMEKDMGKGHKMPAMPMKGGGMKGGKK